MLEGELNRFKFDLRNIEKVMVDISELDNKFRDLNDKVDRNNNEHTKKINTMQTKQAIFDNTVRSFENDVKVLTNEIKQVHNLITDTREN
jgi:hypothetical protein